MTRRPMPTMSQRIGPARSLGRHSASSSPRSPRLRSWYDRARQRFGRLLLLIVNLLIVSPLLIAAVQAGIDVGLMGASSVLGDVAGLVGTFGSLLFFYVI